MTNQTQNAAMTAGVDVLAEMDRRLEIGALFGQQHDVPSANLIGDASLRGARAAVAELIEAGPAMLRFLDQHQYLDRDGSVQRFRAALARVGAAA